MKYQNKAIGVLERTSYFLKAGVLKEKPAWFNVVGSYPPTLDLTRRPKNFNPDRQDPQNFLGTLRESDKKIKTRHSKEDRKQPHRNIFRVPKLEFLEDELRDVFYHQHPWEFSRPKTLIENQGDDNSKCDWSHMLQLHKPLDGESVVQRTLWLLEDGKKQGQERSLFQAYDQARFEFYRLRMEEEMESAVAREEATMCGAIFPSTNLDWGLQMEQKYIDEWTNVASEKTKVRNANREDKSAIDTSSSDDVPDTKQTIWETVFETPDASLSPLENTLNPKTRPDN